MLAGTMALWSFRPGRRRPMWAGLTLIGLVAVWALAPLLTPQPPKVARVGVLCHPCLLERPKSADFPPEVQTGSFLDELRKLGWIEGENITLEWRGAAGRDERLAGLAA